MVSLIIVVFPFRWKSIADKAKAVNKKIVRSVLHTLHTYILYTLTVYVRFMYVFLLCSDNFYYFSLKITFFGFHRKTTFITDEIIERYVHKHSMFQSNI